MLITFEELRNIKHSLPSGSVQRIATQLDMKEQSVRNFFGAKKESGGLISDWHKQPGFNGGVIKIEHPTVLKLAKQIIKENQETTRQRLE